MNNKEKTGHEKATACSARRKRPLSPSPPQEAANTTKRAATKATTSKPTTDKNSGKAAQPPVRGRRKRDPPLKLVPETRQVFKELTFFYIPNSDISPLRRARIRKAREYGVTWSQEFNPQVTHIIVDKHIVYEDVIKAINLPEIPVGVVLVDELYPLDCIQFRAVLNPNQSQYKVKDKAEALAMLQRPNILPAPDSKARTKSNERGYGSCGETPPSSPCLSPKEELQKKPRDEKSSEGDELDKMVQEARRWQHLPLDGDENGTTHSDRGKHGSSDLEDEVHESLTYRECPGEPNSHAKFNQQSFSCMVGGTGEVSSNPNSRTISVLKEMADYYTQIGDAWRPISYRKAIATLQRQKTRITTFEEASKLPFVGKRLALKIEEIALTDHLRRLENTKTDPNDVILKLFMGIYGVGLSQASKWLQAGYRTLEDLKAHAQLTDNQLLGIHHYDDLQKRIPRDEVTALGKVVTAAALEIDATVQVIISGSYRRGAADSGDIDCLVTKPGTGSASELTGILNELVCRLKARKFLVAALAVPRTESGTKWNGCCVLPHSQTPIWRRIDILLVPAVELGAALLYFTGNDIFNRSIRLLARKKGMRLNQRGLYKDVMRGPGGVKITQGELVEGADERKIFEALGVPWRPPEQRIC